MTNSGRVQQNNNYMQGILLAEDLQGYNGKKQKIELLSSYEFKAVKMLQQLFTLKRIQGWASEESIFKYLYQLDQKEHKYYMDFTVETDEGIIFIEVKPEADTTAPKKPREFKNEKQRVNYQNRVATFIKNCDKWTSVENWCKIENDKLGYIKYKFVIWTEKTLSIK